ncbi:hypothetical protein TeGR_g3155, partial [Tetraparma gracilis]
MASDVFLYHAEAAYIVEDNGASVTIPCDVLYNETVPPSAALSVSCELTLATTYKVSVLHSRTNPQLLGGTQHVLTIEPADTNPSSCNVEFPSGKSIVAGSSFDAVVIPFDEFENPTAHAGDAFASRVELGSGRENVNNRHVLSQGHSFSELQTITGKYKLYLYYAGTQEQVADSPVDFVVLPAAADAASSSHNIKTAMSIDSVMENTLELTAKPRDRYNNSIPAAEGYSVSVSGGPPQNLYPPDFSYKHSIPFMSNTDIRLNFTLNGVEIADSPIVVSVTPTTAIYVGGMSAVILVFMVISAWTTYTRIIKAGFDTSAEKIVSVDQKLRKILNTKMRMQNVYMGIELTTRGKIKTNYRKIIHGDDPELAAALDAAGGVLTKESTTIRHQLIVLDLALLTVNEENVLRFRHECFLTKNLSHPNVVKLVGVCWSEDLFACCLEFVENGSLEFWLRLTAGGKKWVAAKKPVVGKNKKKPKKKRPRLSEVTFKGFDHNGEFNPAEHTDTDRANKEEAEKVLHHWWMQRMNPKMGWTEMLQEDGSRLDHGMSGYHTYDHESRCGRAMAHCYVAEIVVDPLMKLKLNVERLLKEYTPPEHVVTELDLTWKGGLWRMSLEAALGVQYLHHHRYWSDGGKRHNGATNEVEEEEAGWKESVIHRDLKPDNMLLTRDWTLKLTDFGEARAQNMGGTMTSVGTPIYIAPEVMRADHYDEKADTWSYGLCLVAMIRAERTLEQFFYQALRKHKRKRNTKGLGMGQMTKYYYSEGWRPILPLSFVKAYPKLHALIQECWKVRRKERPNFDQIVARLQGDIGDEIKRKEEPQIELYSKEDDEIYRGRIGKEDEIEDSDEEEKGGKSTRRSGGVSTAEHSKALAAKDKAMQELKDKSMAELRAKSKAMRELQEKAGAKQKKTEAA